MKTDRVQLSHDLSVFVGARIANYAHECDEQLQWLIPYVEKHAILPLYSGWVETIGILPDGRIRKFSVDGEYSEYEELRPVEEFTQFMAAIVTGAKRYPSLLSAIPKRPGNASTCVQCGGTGEEFKTKEGSFICECGGVGWTYDNAV